MADLDDLVQFTFTGLESATVADTADGGSDLDAVSVRVAVTITARPEVVNLQTSPPRTLRIRPVKVRIEDGVLVLPAGAVGDVRLVANSAVLGINGQLLYDVKFGVGVIGGDQVDFSDQNFTFIAPNTDVSVDMTSVERVAGSTPSGTVVPMIPDHVRLNGSGQLVWSAHGVDIPDPLTLDLDVSGAIASAVTAAMAALVAGAPGALDTLNELAAALGDDPNFATTIATTMALKAPLASPTFTGTVSGVTKSMVGLGGVDNTADTAKPVSTAQAAALALKVSVVTYSGSLSTARPTADAVYWVDFPSTPTNAQAQDIVAGAAAGTAAPTASTVAEWDANVNMSADAFIPGLASTATAGGTTTLTVNSKEVQIFTGSADQIVALPTTGIVAGQRYTIINSSSGTVQVTSSGANSILFVSGGWSATFVALQATPTTAAHWQMQSHVAAAVSIGASAFSLPLRDANGNLQADNFIPGATSTATAAGTTTLTIDSTQVQVFTGSTTQTVKLPTTSVTPGAAYVIVNQSTGSVTVQSSGANTIRVLPAASVGVFTSTQATPTTASHWIASVTAAGGGPILLNPTITNYTESVVAIGTVTSASTLDLTNGTVQTATLTASTACTFTMPTAVAGKSFTLLLKQAVTTGNGSATFTGVKWSAGTAPTITATAAKMDILTFVSDGTNWYGSITQNFTP